MRGGSEKARALTSGSRVTTRNCPVLSLRNGRAFSVMAKVLPYLIHREPTTVELSMVSGVSYATCQRIVLTLRRHNVLKFVGFGESSHGTKPARWTVDLER